MRVGLVRRMLALIRKNTNRVNRDWKISPITRSKSAILLDSYRLLHRYLGKPAVPIRYAAFNDIEELLVQRSRDRAGLGVTDRDLVDRADWGDLGGGAGE